MKSTTFKLHETCWANKDREKGRKKKSCLFRSRKSQKRRGTKWEKMCLLLLFKQLFIWQSFLTPSPPFSPPAAVITYIHFFFAAASHLTQWLLRQLWDCWADSLVGLPFRFGTLFHLLHLFRFFQSFYFFFFALWEGGRTKFVLPRRRKKKLPGQKTGLCGVWFRVDVAGNGIAGSAANYSFGKF